MEILNTVVIALGGAMIGKIFEILFISKKDRGDALIMLVKQLQDNVNSNNEEIKQLKQEVTSWRDKYYTELEEKSKLQTELRQLRISLNKFNQQNHS